MLRVRVSTPLRPSEDPEKVERAVRTLVPQGRVEVQTDRVVGESDSLDAFRALVWRQRILDAARRIMLSSLDPEGRRSTFTLNKQAAYSGLVSFSVGEAPLGDVRIEVEGDDLEPLFKEIAPPTLRGKPVSEEEYERHLELQSKRKAETKYVGREAPVKEITLDEAKRIAALGPADEEEE